MPMRQDCKYFESRSYPNGETVRKCDLDLAPEAPWRCPDDCSAYERRLVDVNWSHGTLVTPPTPEAPSSVGSDDSIGALLDAAEDIVNEAGPRVLAELEKEKSRRRLRAGGGGKAKRRKRRRRS
ncbi:hypothetical protein [Candidatus Poriferisocius sp.]|uniref:hypothetical protein n=1 Tax=Candidatus Poriferisocius sp. TaxID=3101276 RepID=UPI003B0226BC